MMSPTRRERSRRTRDSPAGTLKSVRRGAWVFLSLLVQVHA